MRSLEQCLASTVNAQLGLVTSIMGQAQCWLLGAMETQLSFWVLPLLSF